MGKRKRYYSYGTVEINGIRYYKTYVEKGEGKRHILYARTLPELDEKVEAFNRMPHPESNNSKDPLVRDYAEKWLRIQSARVRATTLVDYTSKVNRYVIQTIGEKRISEVTTDDIKMILVLTADKSASVNKSVRIILRCIFDAAVENRLIETNPVRSRSVKQGGIPKREREALTDEQAQRLIETVRGLPPYVFVMLGLYAGLRREEILGLKWDCVFLDTEAPYLCVRRAWHTENNRPVILSELKTKASARNIPLPACLAQCLREAREKSSSEYVIANSEGKPLTYTQYTRLWGFVKTRTAVPRKTRKPVNGKYVKYMLYPQLGQKARNNSHVVYSLDFVVTPHQLRHTYITNLIFAGTDPKTVQYLAGHSSSQITLDIYAKVKYNRPDELAEQLKETFSSWNTIRAAQENNS